MFDVFRKLATDLRTHFSRFCSTTDTMDANLKTPATMKPLDSPPALRRKSEITDGQSKVFLVIRATGLIEKAYYSRSTAEQEAAKIRGSVLAHAVRGITKTDGRSTVLLEGGGFSEMVDVEDAHESATGTA